MTLAFFTSSLRKSRGQKTFPLDQVFNREPRSPWTKTRSVPPAFPSQSSGKSSGPTPSLAGISDPSPASPSPSSSPSSSVFLFFFFFPKKRSKSFGMAPHSQGV